MLSKSLLLRTKTFIFYQFLGMLVANSPHLSLWDLLLAEESCIHHGHPHFLLGKTSHIQRLGHVEIELYTYIKAI